MFRSGKSHLSQTSTENADNHRRISSPKHFLKCPKLERWDFWPRFLPPRPRAIAVLGVHRSPFGHQELCSLDVAVVRRRMERRVASGAFSGKPSAAVASGGWAKRPTSRKRRKLWAAEFHWFNRLFWTQHLRNCSKQNIYTNKMNEVQYIFLANDIAFDEGKCNNLFFEHSNGQKKTLSSIIVDNMVWNQVQYFKGLKVHNVPKSCGGATSFLQSPFFCDEWRSRIVLHDAPIDVTYASVLLHLVPPSSICCFSLIVGAKSLVTITVVWKFKSKYTPTLTRICCNPLIPKPSMACNVHPSLPRQNSEFLTPWHSLHAQILFSNVVPMSSLQNSNMWDSHRLVKYKSDSPTLPRLIHTCFSWYVRHVLDVGHQQSSWVQEIYPPHKAGRPNFENPIHDWNLHIG